eukprot:5499229-Amphidinium_carterae.1
MIWQPVSSHINCQHVNHTLACLAALRHGFVFSSAFSHVFICAPLRSRPRRDVSFCPRCTSTTTHRPTSPTHLVAYFCIHRWPVVRMFSDVNMLIVLPEMYRRLPLLSKLLSILSKAMAQFTPAPVDFHPQNLAERAFTVMVSCCLSATHVPSPNQHQQADVRSSSFRSSDHSKRQRPAFSIDGAVSC